MRRKVRAAARAEEVAEVHRDLAPVAFLAAEALAVEALAVAEDLGVGGRADPAWGVARVRERGEISGRVAELPQVAAQALEAVQVGASELAAEVDREVAQEEMVEHHLAGESAAPEEE